MKFIHTKIPDIILIEPVVHRDTRGFFLETYHEKKFQEGGIGVSFVQDNHSLSYKGTLRGLHSQRKNPQGKLIGVLHGEIFDVAVDVRLGSPAFGLWLGITLSDRNMNQIYIPPGFLHGFCVLSEKALVQYKCTALYDSADEMGVRFDDPDINISWPISNPLVSEKDRSLPFLADLQKILPIYTK